MIRLLILSALLICLIADAQLIPTRRRNIPGGAGSGGGGGGGSITNVTRSLNNWWKLDEDTGTTTADSIGSANGTFVGSPVWTNGVINFGVQASFNGTHYFQTSQYIQLAANTGGGGGAMTVSAWVRMSDATQPLYIIWDNDNDTSKGYYFISDYSTATDLALVIVTTGGEMTRTAVANTVRADQWIFVLATWDGTVGSAASHMHVYTNNVEVSYSFNLDGTGTASVNNTTSRKLGGAGFSAGDFNGVLDDVRVYTRVLDAGERSDLYQWRGQP